MPTAHLVGNTMRPVVVAQSARDLDARAYVLRKRMRELAADPQQAFPGGV
jgi:transposase